MKLELTEKQKDEDEILRAKIELAKAKLGCGKRFEWRHYENGMICSKNFLCPRCYDKISKLENCK